MPDIPKDMVVVQIFYKVVSFVHKRAGDTVKGPFI